MKKNYSYWIGLMKSLKNTFKVMVLPAIVYAAANYTEWLDPQTAIKIAPIMGLVNYFVTNFVKQNVRFEFSKK